MQTFDELLKTAVRTRLLRRVAEPGQEVCDRTFLPAIMAAAAKAEGGAS